MSDLQTALKGVLKVGLPGVTPKPLMERVWLWLKDHPSSTASRMAPELRESHSSLSSMLSKMEKRKMLTSVLVPRRAGRKVKMYSVTNRTHYEVLPLPLTPPSPTKAKAPAEPESETVTTLPETKAQTVTTSGSVDIESLTLAEARDLYQRLDAYFGRSK